MSITAALYEIPAILQSILDKIAEADGEVTPEVEQELDKLINTTEVKIADAALLRRNLELQAESALAQAKVFSDEAERCKAQAGVWEAAAEKLGLLLVPVLKLTGKVQTPAGTVYLQTRKNYAFELKPGVDFFQLDSEFWRTGKPELNKRALNEAAKEDRLPDEIMAMKTETTSVCLKKPTKNKEEAND
jgi:hypothetical protein